MAIGGNDLYNLIKGANENNFNANNFDASKSSATNNSDAGALKNNLTSKLNLTNPFQVKNPFTGAITELVNSPTKLGNKQNVVGNTKYQYDIFDRLSFGTPPNSPTNSGIEKNAYSTSRDSRIDNRVIINYKNDVFTENLNADRLNSDQRKKLFVNKIKINNKFTAQNYKDPSIETIVSELSGYPTTKISYADFLYCKKLGSYPNNRLVILRRFFQPVDDNLFDSPYANNQQNPLSVMVTWFDEFPLSIRYGEEWREHFTGILEEFGNTVSSLTPKKISGLFGSVASQFKDAASGDNSNLGSPWLKTLWYQFIEDLYKNNSNNIAPNFKDVLTEANPNKIRQSVIKRGLSFELTTTLHFAYSMRYVNGIDPHLAMHNIMANAIRMGSSTSVSIFPKSTQFVPEFVTNLNQGKVIAALQIVYENLSTYLNSLFKGAKNAVENVSSEDIINKTNTPTSVDNIVSTIDNSSYSRRLFSLFRFQLTAAVQADLGIPSGSWHLTIGNPFNPIASVGDLIIQPGSSMDMKFGNELSYNDQPTEVYFSIALKNARPRGAQEIEQIFNAGRGRIYVYPQLEDDPDLFLSDTNPTMGGTTVGGNRDQNVQNPTERPNS